MSARPSHQTVRLARGRHHFPDQGVCALELTSMLAGEGFSDRPAGACPVLSAFVRGYNDALDDERRQDLRAVASALVGSCAEPRRAAERAAECVDWARRRKRFGIFGPRQSYGDELLRTEAAGQHAGRFARRDDAFHAATLAFLDSHLQAAFAPRERTPAARPAASAVRVTNASL